MFGPKQYLRTTNPVDVYTDTFRGVPGPGTVTIQNGDGSGKDLVEDLLIMINGVPLADWSALMQPGHKLVAPISMAASNSILVIILGKPGSYLTFEADAEIAPDATTAQVVGIDGGTVSVTNHLGDTFTLQIPPLALDQDTTISVSALPNALPGPIAQNLYPGAVLGPEGLQFSVPLSVNITPHNPVASSGAAILYWAEDSGHALPLANQSAGQVVISNFSLPVAWGTPTCDDIGHAEWWYSGEPIWGGGPGGVDQLIDKYYGVISLMQPAQNLGCPSSVTSALLPEAISIALQSGDLLQSEPAPEYMPCGPYTILMKRWADVVADALSRITGNTRQDQMDRGWLNQYSKGIKARECKFTIAPPSLDLFVGGTSQITATLLNASGETASCSVIDWYDSNLSAVGIAKNGMTCGTTGLQPGVANVSANCDGLTSSNSTTVKVSCGLVGTYQGGYTSNRRSGSIAVPFTQTGTSVSAVVMGYNVTGTNIDGKVTLGPIGVPCYNHTRTCPARASATLSPDCSTLSGSFSIDKQKYVSGTFSLALTAP